MKEGTRERLVRKKEKAAAQEAAVKADCHTAVDAFHNHQVPCGRLLQECGRDIFPHKKSSSSLLGSLLRRHLRNAVLVQETTKKKKKKKNKRKKNRTSDNKEPEATEATTAAEASAVHVENHPLFDHHHHHHPYSTESQQQETTEIMNKWLDRCCCSVSEEEEEEDDSCPENRDLNAFIQHVQLSTPAVTIDARLLEAACDSISCLSCQHATRQSCMLFQNDIPLGPLSSSSSSGTFKTFVPSSSLLLTTTAAATTTTMDGDDGDNNVERAFDYVAMEEGDSEEIVLVFHRNGSTLECDSLTLLQLEQCVRQIVIPRGLPELEESNAHALSDQEFHQLTANVNQFLQKTRGDLDRISKSLLRVRGELEESAAAAATMASSFDVQTSAVLKDCDDTLDEVLHDLVLLVRHIPTSLDDGTSLYHRLVQCLSEAISAILQAQTSHEGRLVQLANRPGAVPQMALNATHRSSYRDFLFHNLEALAMLESQMESFLLNNMNVHRGLVGYAALEKLVNNNNNKSCNAFPSIEEDHLWQLYEEQTHTVHCGNIREIKETRSQRCHDLMKAISRRQMARCHDISKVTANKKGESLEFEEICEQLYEHDATGEEFPQHRQHVICMFASEVAAVTKTKNKIVIPLKVKQWLRGDDVTDSCVGGCGRQRVTCTLMGLLYKWLMDRCNEWHAELTHIELLQSMMMDDSAVQNHKSKGKKSKKKKKAVDASEEAPRPDAVENDNLDRNTEVTPSEVVSESGARVKVTDADDLSVGKENNENSPGIQHSLSTVAMVSKNGKKDGSRKLDVRDKKVARAVPDVEKTEKSSPSHNSREKSLGDANVASSSEEAEKAKKSSPSHISRKPRTNTEKKVASAVARGEKTKTSSPSHDSRQPRVRSGIKVVPSTAQVNKAEKASLSQGSGEAGTKGEKKTASAVKEANEAKQSSPSVPFREPRVKSGKKAAPKTQVISRESKQPSPIQDSHEACAIDEKAASAPTKIIDDPKQPSPSHDSRKQRAKGRMMSVSTTTQIHSGKSKEQSVVQGYRKIGSTDEKAAPAVTQGEKIRQSCPRDDSVEPRGKSGKKSARTVQVPSGKSKEQSPIQGSRKTGATDEKATSAAVFGTNETKRSTSTRCESDTGDKKLALVGTQVDSEKVESSPSRASAAETAVDIGVVSPTGFQSAEVFLIERLMLVLEAEKYEKRATR